MEQRSGVHEKYEGEFVELSVGAIAIDMKTREGASGKKTKETYDRGQMPRQDQLTRLAHCCAPAVPGAGGAFFKMPLGLEVDALRVGTQGGEVADICR